MGAFRAPSLRALPSEALHRVRFCQKTGDLCSFHVPETSWVCLVSPTVSVSDEACAEVNGLKASRFFSMAEKLNMGSEPFIWLFIRPPWSASGSCCKAVVHDSLRTECQLQKVSPGEATGHSGHEPSSRPRTKGNLETVLWVKKWGCTKLSLGPGSSSVVVLSPACWDYSRKAKRGCGWM